jgi:hypothetical protein
MPPAARCFLHAGAGADSSTSPPPRPHPPGDHTVIAKETARQLGLGTEIANAKGLPMMEADGKVPTDLGQKYGRMILEADGFAEVGRECR